MNAAVIGTSRKESEKRVAIHPRHLARISEEVRAHLFFEKGYGAPFGVTDRQIAELTGNDPADRKALLQELEAVIIPKPVKTDFEEMREGAVVWGWVHSVQQSDIAQIAIDKKMTLVCWENMYHKGKQSRVHIFQRNNEMAGYCGVQHALQLRGIDGNFGPPRRAAVLSFGSVGRGAVLALQSHGIHDITVFTRRPTALVCNRIPSVRYEQVFRNRAGSLMMKNPDGNDIPLIDLLNRADILVNCILQDTYEPVVFIRHSDIMKFKKECLIIDISCDEGMGFQFAHPTSFSHPFNRLGNILYYSVDHTPSLLWDSASWEISASLLPYLSDFIECKKNPVLESATDIKNGIIQNKTIIAFQNRSPVYPYDREESIQLSDGCPVGVEARRTSIS
jgi:alanine dehydrogenase